jgi:hypothetical protein
MGYPINPRDMAENLNTSAIVLNFCGAYPGNHPVKAFSARKRKKISNLLRIIIAG